MNFIRMDRKMKKSCLDKLLNIKKNVFLQPKK